MNVKQRLRNSLVRKIQMVSDDKLSEINDLLSKIEIQHQSKEKTLKLAGSWKDLDDDIFADLTTNLHTNRANDRAIDW